MCASLRTLLLRVVSFQLLERSPHSSYADGGGSSEGRAQEVKVSLKSRSSRITSYRTNCTAPTCPFKPPQHRQPSQRLLHATTRTPWSTYDDIETLRERANKDLLHRQLTRNLYANFVADFVQSSNGCVRIASLRKQVIISDFEQFTWFEAVWSCLPCFRRRLAGSLFGT